MPEMSGVEAIAKLEESEEWMDIPVIFFTAHTKEEYISQCLETGACDIVIKPYEDEKLLEIVGANISAN
jgi:CheY-like chemotaxis protein